MFEWIGTTNRKHFSIAFSAFSSSEADADDEFGESFPKRRMLAKNITLPRKVIVHTKIAKTNKRNKNSKLINAITVTKQDYTICSRLQRSVECGLTYGVPILSQTVM